MNEREQAQQKITEFSNQVRGILGVRAAFRNLAQLGNEGDAEISIRALPTVSALLSSVTAMRYMDEDSVRFCIKTGERAGSASGTHGRTFASPCGIGASRVAGTIGEQKFNPECFAVAIAPSGVLPGWGGANQDTKQADSRYSDFWMDIAALESGTLGSDLLNRRAWKAGSLPSKYLNGFERLLEELSEKGGGFWRDWVQAYSLEIPLSFDLCREVNICLQEFWGARTEELSELTAKIYTLHKLKNKVRNKIKITKQLLSAPGIGHNSTEGQPKTHSEVDKILLEMKYEVDSTQPSKIVVNKLVEDIQRILKFTGDIIRDSARDYAKTTLTAIFGASAAYVVSQWPEIEENFRSLVTLLRELSSNLSF